MGTGVGGEGVGGEGMGSGVKGWDWGWGWGFKIRVNLLDYLPGVVALLEVSVQELER